LKSLGLASPLVEEPAYIIDRLQPSRMIYPDWLRRLKARKCLGINFWDSAFMDRYRSAFVNLYGVERDFQALSYVSCRRCSIFVRNWRNRRNH